MMNSFFTNKSVAGHAECGSFKQRFERYEAGFRPLLKQAEDRHVADLQRVVDLQRELEAKESELRSAHEQARSLSAAVTTVAAGGAQFGDDASSGGFGADGKYRDPTTGEVVPAWKLREFEDLKGAGVQISEGEVRMKMAELMAQARESVREGR